MAALWLYLREANSTCKLEKYGMGVFVVLLHFDRTPSDLIFPGNNSNG